MQQRTPSPFFAALLPALLPVCLSVLALGLSACSLALDTQKTQCSKASDCNGVPNGGDSALICVKGFCQALACEGETTNEADKSCRDRDERPELKESHCEDGFCRGPACKKGGDDCPEGQTCNVARGACVADARAVCGEPGSPNVLEPDKDCASYDGKEDHICEDNVCVEPQCKKTADCSDVSDSASCVMGRCDDVTWGCIGQPDDREVPASGSATLKLKVLDLSMLPFTDGSLKVTACSVPNLGTCSKLPNAKISYDEETGWLSVAGLLQKQRFWLQITAADKVPVDWYTQRPPVGVTEEPEPAVLVPVGIESLIGGMLDPMVEVDLETKSTMIIRAYNCNAENGEGVSFDVSKALADTTIFYLDSGYQVLVNEQATDATGTGGIANARAAAIRITVTRGGALVTEFDVTPRPKVLTYLALYPQDYSK